MAQDGGSGGVRGGGRGGGSGTAVLHDLRVAVRGHLRRPGFALVAVATLALGIGANSAVFSLVDGVLLEPLPYADPHRLVQVWEVSVHGRTMNAAWANFEDWQRRGDGFRALAAYTSSRATVLGGERPVRVTTAAVSRDFFPALRVEAAVGRLPAAGEHRPGAPPVVVVSHRFWRGHLGGAERLEELDLNVSGFPLQVVGVLPAGFDFPSGADLWYPVELTEPTPYRTAHNYRVIGRLADGTDVRAARAEVEGITLAVIGDREDEYLARGVEVVPLRDEIAGPVRRPLWLLLGAAGLVLLVACANLASSFLARATGRQRELAVRAALGAGPWRLRLQLFVESLVLALAGAAAGVGLAALLLRALPHLAAEPLPRLDQVGVDGGVVLFTLVVSVLAALLFGLLPAWGVLAAAGEGAALRTGRSTAGRQGRHAWRALVAVQVALAVLLLAGTGLLLRSLWNLLDEELGFEPRGVLTAELSLPEARYPDDAALGRFHDELLTTLRTLPGVAHAGVVNHPPLGRWDPSGRMSVEGGPEPHVTASYRLVAGDYFRALGIPLLAGRTFDERDRAGAADVVVVNRALAELAWPGEDALGKRMTSGGMDKYWQEERWARVVGVVGDVRHRGPAAAPGPAAYFALRQRPGAAEDVTAVLRGEGGPEALAGAVRTAVRELDPQVPVEVGTLEDLLSRAVADRRAALLLLGGFAVLALVLAALGIYGVVAYGVARRRRELGIRLALGARRRRLLGQVVGGSMVSVGAGLAVGAAAALTAGRLLAGMLHDVSPQDPVTLAAVLLLLATAAVLASLVPARRATRVDPAETLRAE